MPPVPLPPKIRELLAGSPLEAPTLSLVHAVSTVVSDNKTPFFPAYTDHGAQHLERVLHDTTCLIPDDVWEADLLTDRDAAVLVSSSLLHDIGMHIRPHGFVELVSSDDRPPMRWFRDPRDGRQPDVSWSALWADFQAEMRHANASILERILGPGSPETPAIVYDDNLRPERWNQNDNLVIGEFLRRHHARVAHETAIHGFPGARSDLPILTQTMPDLADAIGAIARSHNEPLRVMLDYCDYEHRETPEPWGIKALYLMSLIRIADYLQLDGTRAPRVLMQLKHPASRTSIDEWEKHRAVQKISWNHNDPSAVYASVDREHSLSTHLQLRELFAGLQNEMDVSSSILAERYGLGQFSRLRLSKTRVRSNLDEPSMLDALPYEARDARVRSDEGLFRLMVGSLYGDQPEVAGREVVQNAIDAVRERTRLAALTPRIADQAPEPPVRVMLEELEGDRMRFTVIDRGVGMSADTIDRFFLTVGASFAVEAHEKALMSRQERIRTEKAGRFGVGVTAAFLLDSNVHVETQHVLESTGYRFTVSDTGGLIVLNKANLEPGTRIEIVAPASRFQQATHRSTAAASAFSFVNFLELVSGYFRLDSPEIELDFLGRTGQIKSVSTPRDVPTDLRDGSSHWATVEAPDFDAVRMSYLVLQAGSFVHNGIQIRSGTAGGSGGRFSWSDPDLKKQISPPAVAVFDSKQRIALTLDRSRLRSDLLPFESRLLWHVGRELAGSALGDHDSNLGAGAASHLVVHGGSIFPAIPAILDASGIRDVFGIWVSDRASLSPASSADASKADVPSPPSGTLLSAAHEINLAFDEWAKSHGHPARVTNVISKPVPSLSNGRLIWGDSSNIEPTYSILGWPERGLLLHTPRTTSERSRTQPVDVLDRYSDSKATYETADQETLDALRSFAEQILPADCPARVLVVRFAVSKTHTDDARALAAGWTDVLGSTGARCDPAERAEQREPWAQNGPEAVQDLARWTEYPRSSLVRRPPFWPIIHPC